MKIRHNNILFALILTVGAIAVSCDNSLEEYYRGGASITSEETVYEYLSSNEEYSTFLALIDEVGMKDKLNGSDLITVWAPADSCFTEDLSQMSLEDKTMLVQNHVSITTIFSRAFSTMSTIGTIAGKYLNLTKDASVYMVDGVQVVEVDNVFANGLLHKMGAVLRPQKNLWQWFSSLGDDYSIFRDTLKAYDMRTFDKENSPVYGVDDNGKIIYDSVWVVKNQFLKNVDLSDESQRHTFFVPDNRCIETILDERKAYLASVQRMMNAEDSTAMIHWIMNAALHKGIVNFNPGSSVTSMNSKEMRTDYFSVNDPIDMSNGRVYTFEKMYVPKNVHYQKLVFNPYWIRKELVANGGKFLDNNQPYDKVYNTVNNVNSKFIEAKEALFWQYSTTGKDNAYEFEARLWNEELGCTEDLMVMPGKYTLRGRFIKQGDDFNTDAYDIYHSVNGELNLIATVSGAEVKLGNYDNNGSNGKDGVITSEWEYTGNYDKVRFRVVIPGSFNNGPKRRICIGEWTLIPNDNY